MRSTYFSGPTQQLKWAWHLTIFPCDKAISDFACQSLVVSRENGSVGV